jgi:hypothetical protein
MDSLLTGFDLGTSAPEVIEKLEAGSNADLGLARALSVGVFLTHSFARSNSPQLRALVCRVYSGAHLISPTENVVQGGLNESTPSRRRIELRFTRKNRAETHSPQQPK